MTGLIPAEELKKLQKRMNRLMEDLGLTDLESRYLEEMQRMQKRMSDLMDEVEAASEKGDVIVPLADIRDTNEALIVTMDVPGVDKQDIDITITDDELSVAAERKTEKEVAEKDFHKRERTYKKFERMVKLPVGVKIEEAKAKLADGVLEITLPKEVVVSRKRINIE
ncbi:MAG: Hsp20/alpha crystallin family protein [Methanothrix sp.]|nr:Hsp20/alpha crystallin family protein [Methanothrix sp.]